MICNRLYLGPYILTYIKIIVNDAYSPPGHYLNKYWININLTPRV